MDATVARRTYRFNDFELDLGAHQLRLRGEPVRIERRPFELLVLLVTSEGLLISREVIIEQLWPQNVIIDFDTGLNTLVRKVRHALGDSSEHPAYVETVAGRGYRFIAPVSVVTPPTSQDAPAVTPEHAQQNRRWNRGSIVAALALLAVAAFAFNMWRPAEREPPRISIAVLPFENISASDEFDYLAAGLAEDTSASLAQSNISNLRLIGHISAQAYAMTGKSMPEIGRDLGVDLIVASSLRTEQSMIRVTSRLIRVADNAQVWTASFDRELTSLLELQRELSVAIAEQIRLLLSPEVSTEVKRRQTLNPEAYDLYLRGRYQWSLLSPASSRRALEFYEAAIAKDSSYALAWAGIAQVLSTAPVTGDAEPAVITSRARDAVQRAVQFGVDLTEVQYALGYFHYFLDWDWQAAETAFRRAVALDPNSAIAHLMLGHVLSQTHNHAEAREMMRRARELDPFFSHTFALSSQAAFQAHDYPAALNFAKQAIAINPEAWVGYIQLGQVQSELGELEQAIKAFDEADRYSGGNSKAIAFRAYSLAEAGRVDDAVLAIAALQERARQRYVPPYATAIIYAGLADHDAAFEWLEYAYAARDVHLVFLPVDPRWDELRDDSRFHSLLQRCGFHAMPAAVI